MNKIQVYWNQHIAISINGGELSLSTPALKKLQAAGRIKGVKKVTTMTTMMSEIDAAKTAWIDGTVVDGKLVPKAM